MKSQTGSNEGDNILPEIAGEAIIDPNGKRSLKSGDDFRKENKNLSPGFKQSNLLPLYSCISAILDLLYILINMVKKNYFFK